MILQPASEQPAGWRWLGRISFAAAVREQERLRDAVIRGDGPETLLLCEHDPVVTLGRSANPANVLLSAARAARARGSISTPHRVAATSPITARASWSATRSCACAGAWSAT